jgi:hypothetical protein
MVANTTAPKTKTTKDNRTRAIPQRIDNDRKEGSPTGPPFSSTFVAIGVTLATARRRLPTIAAGERVPGGSLFLVRETVHMHSSRTRTASSQELGLSNGDSLW